MSSEQNNNERHGGQNHSTENELEKYGVWVKSGPKDIVEQNNLSVDDTLDMKDLPDFSFIDSDQPVEDIFDTAPETDALILESEPDSDFSFNLDEETDSLDLQDIDETDSSQLLSEESDFSTDVDFDSESSIVGFDDSKIAEEDPFAALTAENQITEDVDFSTELTEENFDIPDFGETISLETELPEFETDEPFTEIDSEIISEESQVMDIILDESTEDDSATEPFDDQNMVEPIQQIIGSAPETTPSFEDITEVTEYKTAPQEPTPYIDNSEEKHILQEIARELSGLRLEFAQLKQEIESLKMPSHEAIIQEKTEEVLLPKPEPKSSGGFFSDTDEDETISLSGDELINILASADFTEESGDEHETVSPDAEQDFLPETESDSEATLEAEADYSDIIETIDNTDFSDSEEPDAAEKQTVTEDEEPQAMVEDDEFNADSIIDSLDSNMFSAESIIQKIEFDDENLEEPVLEEIVLPENEDFPENEEIIIQRPEDIMVDSSEAFFNDAEENPLAEETLESEEIEEVVEDDVFLESIEPQAEEVDAPDDVTGFENSTIEDILPEMADISEEVLTDDMSVIEDTFGQIEQEALPQDKIPAEENSQLLQDPVEALFTQTETIAEEAEADGFVDVSEEIPDEIILANDDNLFADSMGTAEEQPEADEITDALPDVIQREVPEITDALADEIQLDDSELDDVQSDEPTETVFEGDQWNEPSLELGEKIEKVPPVEEPIETVAEDQPIIPVDLKQDIRSVLSYMDQLLESLPEEKIAEFAQSEHFDIYKKLFKEMGLSQ